MTTPMFRTRWSIRWSSSASSRSAAGRVRGSASRWTITGSRPLRQPQRRAPAFDAAAFSDATGLVNWQRIVKSSHRDNVHPPGRGHRRRDAPEGHRAVEPSLPKNVLVAEIQNRQSSARAATGATIAPSCRCCRQGLMRPHRTLTWDDRPDLSPTMKEPSSNLAGATAATTHRCRAPSPSGQTAAEFLHAESAVSEATTQASSPVRPGVTCGKVADAFFGTLQKRRLDRAPSRAATRSGSPTPPDWGERTCRSAAATRRCFSPT